MRHASGSKPSKPACTAASCASFSNSRHDRPGLPLSGSTLSVAIAVQSSPSHTSRSWSSPPTCGNPRRDHVAKRSLFLSRRAAPRRWRVIRHRKPAQHDRLAQLLRHVRFLLQVGKRSNVIYPPSRASWKIIECVARPSGDDWTHVPG